MSETFQPRSTPPYTLNTPVIIPNEVPVPNFFPGLTELPFQPTPAGGFIIHNNFIADSLTSNYTITTATTSIALTSVICGEPGYCSGNIYENCPTTILSECQKCDGSLAAVMIFFIICLGIAIVLGNVLIIVVGYHKHKHGKKEKNDLCKSSLAIADMIAGILLLTVVVYNFSWTIHATANEVAEHRIAARNAGLSFFVGSLLLFGFSSSFYHLFFMSLLRLLAVSFPLKYKFLRYKTVFWCLVVVWLVSAVAATLPGWFRNEIEYFYQVSLMLYYPSGPMPENGSTAIRLTLFVYSIPFFLMTFCSIATAIVIRRYQKNKDRIRGNPSTEPKVITKEEISVFVTILIMETAFTVAMLPMLVVVVLYYRNSNILNCSNITIPFIFGVYFSMSNSLANVIIYNVREKNFRSIAKEMLCYGFAKAFKIVSNKKKARNQEVPFSLKVTESTSAVSNTTGSNLNENHV